MLNWQEKDKKHDREAQLFLLFWMFQTPEEALHISEQTLK